jgi:hypothetical protein
MHQWNKKGQNKEKWKKKHVLQFKKTFYFNSFFLNFAPLALHFKDGL